MSNRAYKILEINKEPSFNLWHDEDLLNFFRSLDGVIPKDFNDCSYYLEVSVSAIKQALAKKDLWVENDYRVEQLKNDIVNLTDDDFVNYICY